MITETRVWIDGRPVKNVEHLLCASDTNFAPKYDDLDDLDDLDGDDFDD